ncbi:phosphoglycerate mutase [Bombiscardovia nodaiensis]|uniref:Phosphoglycerate mutase n=1 Tax=Bombiscardovia nodaiensis TaxID=2932181 RepID=A0ABM8B953_9BIFI|nr:phosphoglycerate mutase [Bombiscardovia nodaiensis]
MQEGQAPSIQGAGSIILVRHGQTDYNAAGKMQGQIDIPLNATGLWQARQSAQALSQEYILGHPERKQIVVASDLSRAYKTAQVFARPLGLAVETDPRARERSFGQWEGLRAADVKERWPEDYRSWMLSDGGELKHGAESKEAVGQRGLGLLADWSSRAGRDTDLFVFSHGSWIVQTVQALFGFKGLAVQAANFGSLRNAHWVRLVAQPVVDGRVMWKLTDFNRGPSTAQVGDWNRPDESMLP